MGRNDHRVTDTYVFPVAGGSRTVPRVLDFAKSRPGVPKHPPGFLPESRSSALRYRIVRDKLVPVDPAFLAFHLEIGSGGEVVGMTKTLAEFLASCSVVRQSGRLAIGGNPNVGFRKVKRVSECVNNIHSFFLGQKCSFRGCDQPRGPGSFCGLHLDGALHDKLTAKEAVAYRSSNPLVCPLRILAEIKTVLGPFPALWRDIGAWLGTEPVDPGRSRYFVANWALDTMAMLSLERHPVDRLAALAYLGPPKTQRSDTFVNISMTVDHIRSIQYENRALAETVAIHLARFGVLTIPINDNRSSMIRDRGTIPYVHMPVMEKIQGRPPYTTGGLVCGTIVPVGAESALASCCFSATMLLVMAQIFGTAGQFSFSVVHGPVPESAIDIFDAAAPNDVGSHYRRRSGAARAARTLYIVNPAALSAASMAAIIFDLQYKHVCFHGPRIGASGIRIPVFGTSLDPIGGFIYAVLLEEARDRGTLRDCPGTDPGHACTPAPAGVTPFLDVFVADCTEVRCDSDCPHCTEEAWWHRDRLLAETSFGGTAEKFYPMCMKSGTDIFKPHEITAGIDVWRTLCDLTLTVDLECE